MNESKISPDNSTNLPTEATFTVTSNQKNEDARTSLKKLAACHRQFYRRLSLETTTNNHTASTTGNVNDSNILIMAATTSTCTDKKSSSAAAAQESTERNLTVKTLSNSGDQLNDPPSSTSIAELSDSGRVTDDVETASLSNNVIHVLNSSTDVSKRLLTESLSPPPPSVAPITSIGVVSMGTESYQGCKYLETEGEVTFHCQRRRRYSKPLLMTAANLIGKTIDVSNTNDKSDFPTHTKTNVNFGSNDGVDSICSGGSTDVNNDKRNKKTTTTSTIIGMTTTTKTVQSQSLLPPPPVNNQNKWTGTEESNVSCHSTCETFTSSLSSLTVLSPQSRSCLSYTTVHTSTTSSSSSAPPSSVRRSLVEQRKRDLFERSQTDTRARSRSRSPISEDLERNSVNFPSVDRLVKMYTKLLQENKQPAAAKDTTNTVVTILTEDLEKKMSLKEDEDQLKPSIDPHRNSPLSDEGCTLGQSPYSSDCDEDRDDDTESVKPAKKKKEKVARSASSDSALGLDEEPPMEPPANLNQGRRMTLTVTDLPLRPALLPLAEPNNLPDSPTTEVQISLNTLLTQTAIPSKVLLEERVVEIPEDRFGSLSSSRRESAQSCMSDYQNSECGGVRFVRTPSVVVSDYSDDLMCGITLEEIEYFRAQRLRRRSSVETSGTEKDDAASDVSASSSCSNLYYCGSTISALDGAECYVNGIRMPLDRKISDCSNCDGSGDENNQSFVIPEQPEDLKDYINYCTEQMVVQQQQQQQHAATRRPKKVGGTIYTGTDTCNTNINNSEP